MRILAAIQGLAHGDVSDLDLLSRFVQAGDHAAFELLVWRHRRLVYGVCRRVVGNSHDAEDASQATFLLLARQASTIHGANVAGWLARVAYHCAVRVRKRKSGQQSANLAEVPAPEPFLPEPDLSKILDAEVNRLPEKYRLAIVLCYLDGKTYNQVAAELNCPVGTLCGWLTRAKVMLRRRLARRGVTLSIGGLAAYLDGLSSSAAVANETVHSITMAAVAYRVWETFPSPASTIANGVLRMMTWKLRVLPAIAGIGDVNLGWLGIETPCGWLSSNFRKNPLNSRDSICAISRCLAQSHPPENRYNHYIFTRKRGPG